MRPAYPSEAAPRALRFGASCHVQAKAAAPWLLVQRRREGASIPPASELLLGLRLVARAALALAGGRTVGLRAGALSALAGAVATVGGRARLGPGGRRQPDAERAGGEERGHGLAGPSHDGPTSRVVCR